MMTIAGQPFLTDFQTQQLISQFQQKTELNVSQISTQQVYVLSRELSGDERHETPNLFGIEEAIGAYHATRQPTASDRCGRALAPSHHGRVKPGDLLITVKSKSTALSVSWFTR